MELKMRALKPDDYDALIALWKNAGLPHRPEGRDSRASITDQVERDSGLFLGAFRGEQLVGSVIGTYDGRRGWLNRVAVDPAERRKGVAKTLLEKMEGLLRERGARIIAVLVDEENTASLSIFRSLDYKVHRDILYLTKRDSEQV